MGWKRVFYRWVDMKLSMKDKFKKIQHGGKKVVKGKKIFYIKKI